MIEDVVMYIFVSGITIACMMLLTLTVLGIAGALKESWRNLRDR